VGDLFDLKRVAAGAVATSDDKRRFAQFVEVVLRLRVDFLPTLRGAASDRTRKFNGARLPPIALEIFKV
jgi:hypothetical protein